MTVMRGLLITLLLLSACVSDEGCEAEPYETVRIPPGPVDAGSDAG